MELCVNLDARAACGTCDSKGIACDEALPACRVCQCAGLVCTGYAVRIRWPEDLLTASPSYATLQAHSSLPTPDGFSSLCLPATENHLVLHFTKNISRLALAVDYHGNGYRKFATLALHDPVVLNAMLAVACSHLCKWQHTTDTDSRMYLKRAVTQLQQRFRRPALVGKETTLVAMLLLSTYEVFNGSSKWKHHYNAISGWIQAYASKTELDPFLKTWITLMDTQSGLNRGATTIPQVAEWTSQTPLRPAQHSQRHTIDPLLGCSVHLPYLMVEAARLFRISLAADPSTRQNLEMQISLLQERVRACEIPPSEHDMPHFAVTCYESREAVTVIDEVAQYDLAQSAVATAEIFRHATHIYVHRIISEPTEALPYEMQQSVDTVFELLPRVPNAVGPGANLGWALVVIGSEIDDEDRREYLRCRWKTLQVLGIGNAEAGAALLEDVWSKRDAAHLFNETIPRWQQIMCSSGTEQILI